MVLGILICIPTFILCGFEHSIADIFYFCNARIFSWQAVLVVLLVALGNALGALIIPAARLVYQPKEGTIPLGEKRCAVHRAARLFLQRSHLLIDILLDAVCVRAAPAAEPQAQRAQAFFAP